MIRPRTVLFLAPSASCDVTTLTPPSCLSTSEPCQLRRRLCEASILDDRRSGPASTATQAPINMSTAPIHFPVVNQNLPLFPPIPPSHPNTPYPSEHACIAQHKPSLKLNDSAAKNSLSLPESHIHAHNSHTPACPH